MTALAGPHPLVFIGWANMAQFLDVCWPDLGQAQIPHVFFVLDGAFAKDTFNGC